MFCPNCGTELKDEVNFCPQCGAKVSNPIGKTTSKPVPLNDGSLTSINSPPSEENRPKSGPIDLPPEQHSQPPEQGGQRPEELQIPHQGPNPIQRLTIVTEESIPGTNKSGLDSIIQKNIPYYLAEFHKAEAGEKTKFNWATFFFGTFFCIYRKCYKLAVRYYLIPLCISFTGSIITVYGIMNFFPRAIIGGGAISLVATIWGLINGIRLGRTFNAEYYQHCLSALEEGDSKKYGVAIGPVVLFTFTIVLVSVLINLPWALSDNNPINWGGAPTPGLAKAWGLMDSEEEPTGTFDLAPNPYYAEMDAYDYNDLIDVLSDYGAAKAFVEKYSDTGNRLCVYNVRLQTHDEISVYDPTELLRFRLFDDTTEGKTFYTDYDYMIVGNMNAFVSTTDYSYHQVELAECEVYDEWDRSQFTGVGQGNSIDSNVEPFDFVGDFYDAGFLGDDLFYAEGLTIDQSGSKLNVLCAGYRVVYFEAEVDPSRALNGDTLHFQGYDTYTDSTYDVALTYVPAEKSSYQVDTIYMKASGLGDTTYIRYEDKNNAYPDGYTVEPTNPFGIISDGDQQFYEEHGYYPFEDPNYYSKNYVPDDMKEYYESFDIVSLTEILEDESAFYYNHPVESPIAIFGIVTVVDLSQSYVSVRDINNTGYATCHYDNYDSSGASQFAVGDPVMIYGYISDISIDFTTDKIVDLVACKFFDDYVV